MYGVPCVRVGPCMECVLQCAAVGCSVLQRVAVCCSVLQCVAMCCGPCMECAAGARSTVGAPVQVQHTLYTTATKSLPGCN